MAQSSNPKSQRPYSIEAGAIAAHVEVLEARQLLSGSAGEHHLLLAAMQSAPQALVESRAVKTSTTPAERLAQQQANAAARAAAAAARKQQLIAREISSFVAHLTTQVRHYRHPSSAVFQAHIAGLQNAFAARIARQGGSYTPIPFEQLLLGTAPTPPAAPVVTGTAASASEIDLSWPAVATANAYKVESSSDGGTTWGILTSTATTSYANVGLNAASSYQYRVTAIGATGVSSPSQVVTVVTLLTAPTNLAAVASSATNVNLTWSTVSGASGYKLERSTDGKTWNALTPATPFTGSSSSYADASVSAGTTYYYRISSTVTAGSSSPCTPVSTSTFVLPPTITATTISATEIDLAWSAVNTAFSYTIQASSNNGATWNTLATQAATGYADTGLSADTHLQFRVSATNAAGASSWSSTASATTLLGAPTGFAAVTASGAEIDLSWIAVTDATGYKIERSTDGTNFTTLSPSPALTGSSTSYHDTGVSAGINYTYRISSLQTAASSVASSTVTAMTLPATPTLTGTIASATEVDLTWTGSTGATSYKLERSSDGGVTWTTAVTQATLTYSDHNLVPDTAYKYRVSAIDSSGASPTSTLLAETTILPAPSGVVANVISATEVDLSWNVLSDAVTYKIERSSNGGSSWSTLTSSQAGSSGFYADTTAIGGTTYSYRVSATNTNGTSAPSSIVTVLTLAAAPTVTATVNSATAITLTWTASTSATAYKVESSSDGGNTWTALSPNPTTATASYTSLTADTLYKFRVTAINSTGNSAPSAIASATTILATPVGLTGTVISSTEIDLTWSAERDATSYKLERSSNGGTSWTTITPASPFTSTSISYNDTGLTAGTSYTYRISGVDASGTSTPQSIAALTTLPAAPLATATVISATEIDLAWATISNTTGYKVERSADAGNTWTTLVATQTGITYQDRTCTADTAYKYRVTALNGSSASLPSATLSATTFVLAPTGLSGTIVSGTEIDLAWSPVTDALTYKVEKSTNGGSSWTTLAAAQSGVTYADIPLTPGSSYMYRVSAINSNGASATTATAALLTYPAAPTLSATVASPTEIDLTWTASTSATNYKLERSSDGGNTWTQAVVQTALTYKDTSLSPNVVYKYRVSATNATGYSPLSAVISANTALPAPTMFAATVASATEVDLAWKVAASATSYKIERSADSGTTWITLVPGTALTGASVAFADTTVSGGITYSYRISTVANGGYSAPSATITALTSPIAPVLSVTSTTASAVNLSWTAPATATSYKLESSTNGGTTWSTVVTQATTTYANTGLTVATIYKYRVTAINASGGTVSAVVSASTNPTDPMSLVATATSASQVNLTWTTVSAAATYKIDRSPDGQTWTTLNTSLNSASVSYNDTGLTAGTVYYYRLTAIDSLGTQIPAGVLQTLTFPAAPASLTATPVSPTQINLAWTPAPSATGYQVQESTDGGTTWSIIATPTGVTYSVTGLTTDTAYKFNVEAVNASGTSVASSNATATTLLTAPTSFAGIVASPTEIDFSWVTVNDAHGYVLQRSVDGVAWTSIAPNGGFTATSISYHDTAVTAGTTYYYRLFAVDAANNLSTAATSGAILTLPATPTLTAVATSPQHVALSWTSIVSATNYLLERSTDAGVTWTNATAPLSATTFTDTNTPGTRYVYRVSATNGTGYGATSTTVSIVTPLVTPANFTATVASATEVDLAWSANADATGYIIQRSQNGTTWTTLTTPGVTGASNTFADTTVAADSVYYYHIAATNATGSSSYALVGPVTTLPAAPVLTATVASSTSVTLTWTSQPNIVSYKVESSTDGGVTWATLSPAPTTTTTTYSSLSSNATYVFRVSATNTSGTSIPSLTRTVVTFLSAPNVFQTTVISASEIDVNWNPVIGATGYNIQRSSNGGTTWTALVTSSLTGASTVFADTTVAAGTTYAYRIAATNASGSSAWFAGTTVTSVPAAPTLTAAAASASSITLSWTAPASATGYKVERSSDGGTTWTTLTANQAAPTVTYTSGGLLADTTYTYRVSAINGSGTSVPSATASAKTPLASISGFTATVISAGEIDLAWSPITDATAIKIERSLNGTTWVTLSTPSVTGASTSFADTTVTAGTTYTYRISATNGVAYSSPALSSALTTNPAAPVLSYAIVSPTAITFTWTASATAATYKLEKSLDGGNSWSTVITQATTSYPLTGLTADTTYQFRVSAINSSSVSSAPSAVRTVTTLLNAPASFTVTVVSATQVNLAWSALADTTTFTIQRSVNNSIWTTLTSSLAGTATTYSDTTVVAGTAYYYRVYAVNANGTSAAATAASVLTYPGAPTVVATPVSSTSVALNWAAIQSATGYKVESSSDGGFTWTTLAANNATPSYTATSLAVDTAYKFRVSSINGTGTSAPSVATNGTTLTLAPTGLAGVSPSSTEIDLTWQAVTDATGYKLEYSANSGSTWTTIVPGSPFTGSSTSYNDTGLNAGATYQFRISTISAAGTSTPSAPITVPTVPAAPATLTATTVSASQINLAWTAVTGATSYTISSSSDNGTTWTPLASPTTLTYADINLTADHGYKFKVTANNASGSSVASTVASATTLLTSPTNFAASVISASEIDLSWTAVSNATNYKIERSIDNTTWTQLSTSLTGSSASFHDTSAVAGTTYYYRISAIDAAGTSAPSAPVSGLTYPAAPVVSGTAISTTQINITWPAVQSATSYTIVSSSDGGTTWNTPGNTQAGNTFQATGLTADTSYQFQVTATNASGTSVASNTFTLSTLLGAVTNFATASTTPTSINLTWTAVTDATGYQIQRTQNGTTWVTLTNTGLTGASASYTDGSLTSGATYTYRIAATSASGATAWATGTATVTLPTAPVVTATAVSSSEIDLTWTQPASETGYVIIISTDGGMNWSNPGISQTSNSYHDTGLTADSLNEFAVAATNASGSSANSSLVALRTLLAAPSGFSATPISANEIDLAWTSSGSHATGYTIQRELTGGTWATIPALAATAGTVSEQDLVVAAGTSYDYRIAAISASGTSAWSTQTGVVTVPAAPIVTAIAHSSTEIDLSWPAVTGATGYTITSSSDGGSTWTSPGVTQTGTTYADTGLTPDHSYQFQVTANDATGSSVSSNTATVKSLLVAPTTFVATPVSASEIDLSWDSAGSDCTGFVLQRSLNGTTWTTMTGTGLTGASVGYHDTSVAAGTNYYYRIAAVSASGTGAYSTTGATLTFPGAPTLSVASTTTTGINLSWTSPSSATAYTLETSTDSGSSWTALATAQAGTTYADGSLTADTAYEFKVEAINGSGTSAFSNVLIADTMETTPTSFTVTPASASENDLAWASIADATGFKIERSLNNSTWTTLSASGVTGSSTGYNDTGLTAGTTYWYRVTALGAVANSAATAAASGLTYPAAPTIAGTAASSTVINLSWLPVPSATSYTITSSSDGGTTWTSPGVTQSGVTYQATSLTADTSYKFKVTASNASGASVASNVLTVKTMLAVPSGLATTPVSGSEIDLAWTAESTGTGYAIQRSLNGTTWTTLTTSSLTGASAAFNDTGLSAGTTYYYRIAAISSAGTTAFSSSVTGLTYPAAPTLSAVAVTATKINLSWTTSLGAATYTIQSSSDGGTTWTSPGITQAGTTYSDTTVVADQAYEYRVIATNASGSSGNSNVANVTTPLAAPASFTVTAASAGEIDLAWTACGSDCTGIKVERSLTGTVWTTLSTPSLTGSSTTYADSTVLAGTTYYYRISAISAAGTSAPTAALSALTNPAAPALTATVISATQFNLSWGTVASATSYTIQSSSDGGTTWTSPGVTQATATYSATGLTADTSYKFRVVATNATGASAFSNIPVAKTLTLAPASFTAASTTAAAVNLTWAAVTDATGYKIERSANQTTWTTLVTSALTGVSTSFSDSTVAAGTTYYYRISTIAAQGNSAPSAAITATTLLAAPTGLAAQVVSANQINLSWTKDTAAGLTGYNLYIATSASGPFTLYSNFGAASTSAVVGGLTTATDYYFELTAVNAAGESVVTAAVHGRTN